ncbi:beta-lactamase [Chryseobacterium sp. StRB126]|uniref:serine hydrolase n=1 Tax=Chryseobacterium sp. StRB126 TaxID=878220 RepID=UPI0004E98BB5|nr:beta-lactamase [Chryseobacterium sp. StRB126]
MSRKIDGLFKEKMKTAGIVGLSAAIISDNEILWSNADKNKNILYTKETIMNIGSVSKSITGIIIIRVNLLWQHSKSSSFI